MKSVIKAQVPIWSYRGIHEETKGKVDEVMNKSAITVLGFFKLMPLKFFWFFHFFFILSFETSGPKCFLKKPPGRN